MATPIGHCLAGYGVYLAGRPAELHKATFWLCLLMAIAPDLDFVPGILQGQPNRYHQEISHSLGAALIMSFTVAVLVRREGLWQRWSLLLSSYVSHLVLDFLAPDSRPPYGQPLLWPISSEYYLAPSGLQILWGVHHAKATLAATSEWVAGILQPRNLAAIGIEVLVTSPLVLLGRYIGSAKPDLSNTDYKRKNDASA